MRNMSFSITTEQIKNRTKTVTRRLGWLFLKEGELVQAVEKCQGLKKGEKVKKLVVIRVKLILRMGLCFTPHDDCEKEGFPKLSSEQFIRMFCKANKCTRETIITRIAFEYVD